MNNQAQGYHVLREGTDNCSTQSEICFLLCCVFHTLHVLKGRDLTLVSRRQKSTSSLSCPGVPEKSTCI